MEEQAQGGEPIVYVGGLGEPPKRHVWPFALLGLIPVAAVVAIAIFWTPIRSLGASAGRTVAPYSLSLDRVTWSSNDMIATVPVNLTLSVSNADQRTVHGITVRFVDLDRAWEIVGASSPNTVGDIQGKSIYFSNQLRSNESVTLTVTMRPSAATEADVGITLSAGHAQSPANVQLADGTSGTGILITAKVRNPTDADADAQLTALYDPLPAKDQLSTWQIHVANTGPVAINRVVISAPAAALSSFQFLLTSQGSILQDGHTFQFDMALPPGGQAVLLIGVVPHVTGHYLIPFDVFLEKSAQPLRSATGGPPITVDLTVA
jgi:hypothetical protein